MPRLLVAALLAPVVLAACGEIKTNHLADAPLGSGDAGSNSIDAASDGRMSITVHDLDLGNILVGVQVVIVDSTGTQVVATDATGTATAKVEDGATVTVFGTDEGEQFTSTLYGVKHDDKIVLGDTFDDTAAGTFTVTFPATVGAGDQYTVFGPCGNADGGTGSATLSFTANCKVDPMEIVVVDTNASTGVSTFLDKAAIPFVDGGSVALTGAFRSELTFAVSITGAASVTNVDVEHRAQGFEDLEAGTSNSVTGGTASLTTPFPVTASAIADMTVRRTGFGTNEVLQKVGGNATTYGLDVGATVLPWLGAASFDASTQTAHVDVDTDDSKGDDADGFFCVVIYNRAASGSNTQPQSFRWGLFADTPKDLIMPTLPGDLASSQPLATDQTQIFCAALESDAVSGYDTVRQDFFKTLNDVSNPNNITGVVRESSSLQNED